MSVNKAVHKLNVDLHHLRNARHAEKSARSSEKKAGRTEKSTRAKVAAEVKQITDEFESGSLSPTQSQAALGKLFSLGQKDQKAVDTFHTAIDHAKSRLAHAKKAVSKDRKAARKALKPAEYHLGLKQTNKDRKALGLKALKKPLRHAANPHHVTRTMRRLATDARSVAMHMGGYNSQGLCATGVSRTIREAMGITVGGNGNQIDNNLPRSKFKQIHIPLSEALKIPGLVLTWEHTSTPEGRIYGHTAITLGNGKESASDFVEYDTLSAARSRTGLKIFMPIH